MRPPGPPREMYRTRVPTAARVPELAEGVGFEPTRGLATPGGFQDRCLQPLGHPSAPLCPCHAASSPLRHRMQGRHVGATSLGGHPESGANRGVKRTSNLTLSVGQRGNATDGDSGGADQSRPTQPRPARARAPSALRNGWHGSSRDETPLGRRRAHDHRTHDHVNVIMRTADDHVLVSTFVWTKPFVAAQPTLASADLGRWLPPP